MKRVVIVHCWDGTPNYCWYPWTKQQLEAKGFQVEVPAMPETETPKLSLWLPKLKKVIGKSTEDLVLVGHSIGTVTIMRYLEQLPVGSKISGLVLVAGFTNDLGFLELENFFQSPLDFAKIRSRLNSQTILIHSDNDPYVPLRYGEQLKQKLDAKLVVQPGLEHFSGSVDRSASCTELPAVTEAVENLSK